VDVGTIALEFELEELLNATNESSLANEWDHRA
jgi:hypothetical protein